MFARGYVLLCTKQTITNHLSTEVTDESIFQQLEIFRFSSRFLWSSWHSSQQKNVQISVGTVHGYPFFYPEWSVAGNTGDPEIEDTPPSHFAAPNPWTFTASDKVSHRL